MNGISSERFYVFLSSSMAVHCCRQLPHINSGFSFGTKERRAKKIVLLHQTKKTKTVFFSMYTMAFFARSVCSTIIETNRCAACVQSICCFLLYITWWCKCEREFLFSIKVNGCSKYKRTRNNKHFSVFSLCTDTQTRGSMYVYIRKNIHKRHLCDAFASSRISTCKQRMKTRILLIFPIQSIFSIGSSSFSLKWIFFPHCLLFLSHSVQLSRCQLLSSRHNGKNAYASTFGARDGACVSFGFAHISPKCNFFLLFVF